MTDDAREAATHALLRRRRWAAGGAWTALALGLGAIAAAMLMALLGEPGDLPGTVAVLGGVVGGVALPVAPLLTRDVRGFERELAGIRSAASHRRWPPQLTALLEVSWGTDGCGWVMWNNEVVAVALHRPGMIRVTRLLLPVQGGGIWFREVATGLMHWVRFRIDDHRYLRTGRSTLVDETGRAFRLPRAKHLRSGAPVSVWLPGEIGPIGAVALLGLTAYPRDRAESAQVADSRLMPDLLDAVDTTAPPAAA